MKKIVFLLIIMTSVSLFCQENQFFSDDGYLTFQTNNYRFNIVLVPNLADAIDSWENPDENGNSHITAISSVRRGDLIAIFIVFSSNKENVELTYNFSTLKPDGTFSEKNELILYIGSVNKNVAIQGRQLPIIIYHNYDPIGQYQFQLDIYDFTQYLGKAILEFEVK